MLTLNFDAATEQALNALAQTEERSIEQVLIEALQLYLDAEKLENQELNEMAEAFEWWSGVYSSFLERFVIMYALDFHPAALKEWRKLDYSIREQF